MTSPPTVAARMPGFVRVMDERLAGQMRYVFRHLPNRRVHAHAQLAAEAA